MIFFFNYYLYSDVVIIIFPWLVIDSAQISSNMSDMPGFISIVCQGKTCT